MKSIINFFKSLFTAKKEEIFCETVKREAPKAKRGRKPKAEKEIGKETKAPIKKSKKSEN